MAAPSSVSSASANPFHSRERLHFPEFSPVFSRHGCTPESAQQGQKAFHWSIDHIARLKPADIDTDPFTLVTTNGHSPENDEETQQAAERFFSQRTILPSPWPAAQTRSSMRHTPSAPRTLLHPSLTPGLAKKVTFSPLPPSMAYIRNDSQESDIREDGLVDAATQTAVTIPLAYNLDELLGPAYIYTGSSEETSMSATRDLANTSLRRKLFGKPDRIVEEGEEEAEGEEGESYMQLSAAYVTPLKSSERHLSSTPLKPPPSHPRQQHSSHTPYHSSPSPQIILTKVGGIRTTDDTNPATSSFVLTPGGDFPVFSPIEGITEDAGLSAGRTKESSEACKRLFSNTPNKLTPQSTPLTLSPLPTCPPFSPILSHPNSSGGVRSGGRGAGGDGVKREPTTPTAAATNDRVSSANKGTSTPYHGGPKRKLTTSSVQLSSSPLPTTLHTRDEGERERREENGEEGEGAGVELVMEGGGQEMEIGQGRKETEQDGENESSEELPQPLSIADLQTENDDDLTSITGITTCTSYFTQLATEDGDSNAASERQQPLHSTVAVPNSVWNPSIIAAEPHWGAHLAEDNTAGCHRLPSIREISRINTPSMNATDSGVAASSYFNQPTGGSLAQLTSSGGVGGALNSTKPLSADLEYRKRAENERTEHKRSENSDNLQRHQRPGSQSRLLSSEVDSGLATSPDQNAAPAGLRPEGTRGATDVGPLKWRPPLTKPPTPVSTLHSHPPRSSSVTPTRYSTIQFYRNHLGVPLAVTQKSGFYSNRALLRSDVLPSQLKFSPFSFPRSPGSLTPNRHTSCSNWFGGGGGSVTGQAGFSSPGFPDEVLRKKETLKAKLQFCSPVRSRSPVSPLPSTRRPLSDTLNLRSPATNRPFSPLPSSHPLLSPLPSCAVPYNHLLPPPSSASPFPLSPLYLPQRDTHTDMWQQAAHWQYTQ